MCVNRVCPRCDAYPGDGPPLESGPLAEREGRVTRTVRCPRCAFAWVEVLGVLAVRPQDDPEAFTAVDLPRWPTGGPPF